MLIGSFTLDQDCTIVQDYELLIKSRWTKHQNPFRTLFRSRFRNNNFLLGVAPRRYNPSSTQIYKEDKGKQVINEMFKMSLKVQCAKYQCLNRIFFKCISKPLVIHEHKDIGHREDYCIHVYEPNPWDFCDINEEDLQEERHNTISPNKSENKVNKKYNNSVLVVEKEV